MATLGECPGPWSRVEAPGGHHLLMGVVRATSPGRHVGIVIVTGTEGLNTDSPRFAHELAARGFDVAFGCWFASTGPRTPTDPAIDCADAPQFVGVSDAAVADLDARVAMLRATTGATDPVVSIAGMAGGTTAWGHRPSEVDVVSRAAGVVTPVLLLHGKSDRLVPVQHARDMELALRMHGDDVEAKYHPGADHGLAQIPGVRADLVEQIMQFLCSRSQCATTTG